jgi:hypothetical protein
MGSRASVRVEIDLRARGRRRRMVAGVEVADVASPIGLFRLAYQGSVVRVVDLLEPGTAQTGVPAGALRRRPPFRSGTPPARLREYFRNGSSPLDLEVAPESASEFDRQVWETLRRVPAGKTVTYGELARRSGYPGAARAVGGRWPGTRSRSSSLATGSSGRAGRCRATAWASGASAGCSITKEPGRCGPGRRKGPGPAARGPSTGRRRRERHGRRRPRPRLERSPPPESS